MAFGFGGVGNAPGSGPAQGTASASVNQGPDLELVSTENLGFLSIAGDAKVRFTSAWSPAPAQTASLLTIASRKGLVAAAGPDGLTIATTENVRKAFSGSKDGDSDFRSFKPELTLPLPTRICQLTFTADENYLVLSAETGGGLAVYDVQTLLQGSTSPAFQIPTNGESLRALVPNPMPERGELCAVVTDKGNLLIADMKKRDFVPGQNGQILKAQVSCVAWSTKGKQLVAGLGDGTIQQMTPSGDLKATIPKPPSLNGDFFVSFLAWLENDLFLSIHVSTAEQPPQSCYHLITRQGQNFNYQKMTDPVDPFGSPKVPHHTAARLKDFDPNLQDLLVFSSTATPDIGLMSRSKTPLTSEMDATKITGVFTTTELADDSKRATLPMGETLDSGLPVGAALDLSSKEPVYKPIPTDEIEQSAGPLPGYWVLNDEGVLSAWWIIYNESIRAGTTYRNLAAVEGGAPAPTQPAKPNPFGAPSASSGVQPSTSSPFSASNASAFGAPSSLGSKPAFGGASALGSKPSPWGSQPASSNTGGATFGSSAFGGQAASATPTFGTPSFGQQSGIGAKASPWAAASTAASTPAFGQSGFASAKPSAPFSSTAGTSSMSGGFASFANKGAFGALSNGGAKSGNSIFGSSKPAETSMDANSTTSFPPPSSKPAVASNPFGSQPFKLTSSFQPDPKDKADEGSKGTSSGGTSMFGSGFVSAIGEAAAPSSPGKFGSKEQSTTPTTTPAPSKFFSQTTTAPASGGIFGLPAKPASNIFGAPKIKAEPESPKPLSEVPRVPLPPDSTSKASYPLGESSSSSATPTGSPDSSKLPEEAPLPPGFGASKSKPAEKLPLPPDSPPSRGDDIPLPPDPSTNKKVYDVKFPPLPGEKEESKPKPMPTPEASDDAPLPPDPTTNKKVYNVKFQPVPGVDSQATKAAVSQPAKAKSVFDRDPPKSTGMFMFPTNPPPVSDSEEEDDESDEAEGEDASEAGTEGSGVDVAKDLSPPPGSKDSKDKSPGYTPQSSFDGLGGSFSTISRPEAERKSLFGNTGQTIPTFPQPNPVSPRSPSPIRGAIPPRVLGSDQSRSFSAPGMASQLLGASQRTQSRPISGRESVAVDSHIEQQRKAREKKEAEEAVLLVDEEDERKQELLRASIKPTLELDEFIAHAGPAPAADNNIPAQVEAVYRDINAMIDTLGLNGRSLANFIAGHAEALRHERREKEDLSDPDDWTIGELEDLSRIVSRDLTQDLRDACITDAEDKVAECQDLLRDLVRDRSKRNDVQKIIHARFDPDQATANRALPLTTEQAGRQGDLRRDLAHFTRLLAETEESLTMLRAKIASAGGANGKCGPVPTIDAVVRTITKMTAMAEKRSGDVDLLENRMRSLRFASPGTLNFGASMSRSREGSPFNTPKKQLTSSLMFSPERSFREGTPGHHPRASAMRHSLSASVASIGGGMFAVPPRKKMSGFGEVEKKAVKERRARRAVVLGKVRNAIEQRGPVVIALDETD